MSEAVNVVTLHDKAVSASNLYWLIRYPILPIALGLEVLALNEVLEFSSTLDAWNPNDYAVPEAGLALLLLGVLDLARRSAVKKTIAYQKVDPFGLEYEAEINKRQM